MVYVCRDPAGLRRPVVKLEAPKLACANATWPPHGVTNYEFNLPVLPVQIKFMLSERYVL